ncbi:ABC transporter substrate-binding protein [Catellatospora bangladeshensis]|uniref:Sugar ABC transporter substrate-binding protein n=1 Tax=Catellatospora bangladeshensis TaxID=310355 RepID=A0A8J3JT96_9ACTN|nr:sugar ABC transporter substrate-binding protein [Catellatospora bangladeshensis]GIF86333.1 sugar ABC transporter substrate-binding protein [Catellatospora bangladeshensis]
MAHDYRPTDVSRRSLLRGAAGGLFGAALLGSTPLLTACGSGSGSGGNAKELVFWNFYGPNPDGNAQSKWFTDLVDKWNADNEVKIKLHYLPVSEYLGGTALQTAFSSGAGPDIFIISPGDFLRYYNGGVLTDLTPHLASGAQADFADGVLDTRTVDGKVYGLPMEIEPLAMYYSVDAYEKAGLSEADLPKTWDQLLDVGRKLTSDKRFGVLFETAPGYYQNFTWYPFMWMGGAAAVGADGKSGFDNDAVHKALGLWQSAVKNGISPKKPQGDGAGNAVANLASGFCAMQQTGIWSISQLETDAKDFKYGVFPLPTPTGGTYTTDMGGWAFCANAKGANPEAAAKFITWALGSTDADGVERMRQWNTVVKTNVPSRKSVKEAATKAGAFEKPALKTFMEQVAPGGRAEPRYTPEVYKAISDAIQATMLGGAVPATAAAEASAKIDAFLSGYKGAPII